MKKYQIEYVVYGSKEVHKKTVLAEDKLEVLEKIHEELGDASFMYNGVHEV